MIMGVKLDSKELQLPEYATVGSAGLDLISNSDFVIYPGKHGLVHTGMSIAIPWGYCGMVCSRSGLALRHGVSVLNSPGIIDADYRGELCVILANFGQQAFTVQPGMKIAQLVITPCVRVILDPVNELPDTKRGNGGFGSTGI